MSDLTAVPGVPESRLPADLAAALPATTPAPPWHCRVRAVVWVQRPRTLAAVVDYLDSPVGPYREVFAGLLVRGGALHVPFIAVDSLPSVHGGRAHWALPKAVATFTGEPSSCAVEGDGWSVRVTASGRGPRLPVVGPLVTVQEGRRATARLAGRGRLARVQVEASGPTLTGWLGSGTHLGVVADGTMVVHGPR